MSNPVLGVETSVLLKKEGTPGTRESLASGGVHTDLMEESLDYIPVQSDLPGMVGTRQRRATLDFVSHNDGSGSFKFRPRSAQLEQILELILGVGGGVAAWTPINDDATDLDKFTIEVNKAGQDQVALVGCKVNTATFRSEANGPLEIELAIIASSGARNSGAFTAWAATQLDAEKPFLHGNLVMSGTEVWLDDGLSAGNVECRMIEFTLNNNLADDAYCNSQDRRLIPVGLFTMEGSMEVPYNATTKGFWTEMINAAKVKFTATWTDADSNTIIADFVVKLDGELPKISDTENQWLTLNFHGVADGTDANCIEIISTE